MATPPSSVAKSKPRCTEVCPVDISVRLPARMSGAGLFNSIVVTLSALEWTETGRDRDRDEDRLTDVERLMENERLIAAMGGS